DAFWPAMEIQLPLIAASRYLPYGLEGRAARIRRLLRRGKEELRLLMTSRRHAPVTGPEPVAVKTGTRVYRLHEAFVRPHRVELITVGEDDVRRLLVVLDDYRAGEAP